MLEIFRRKLLLQPDSDRFEIRDDLLPHQRVAVLGKSQHVQQRIVCVQQIVDCCFQTGLGETIRSLLPLVAILSSDSDSQVRAALFSVLSDLSGYFVQADYDVGYRIVCETLVVTAMTGLRTDVSMLNRKDASSALVELSCHLLAEDKSARILFPLVQALASEKDEDYRSLFTECLGALSPSLGVALASEWVVAQLCSLSEDSSHKVRRSTVLGLCEVIKVVPIDLNLRRVVPVFINLCADHAAAVRLCCVDRFHIIFQAVAATACAESLAAVYMLFFDDVSMLVQFAAASHSGYLLALLKASDPSFVELLDKFSNIACISTENSLHFAKTFSAVLRTASATAWDSHLSPVFIHLMRSQDAQTRRALASSFGVIARTVGRAGSVLPAVFTFLADDSPLASAFVRVVPECIACWDSGNVLVVLKRLAAAAHRNDGWRLRETMARAVSAIIHAVASSHASASEELVWDSLFELWLRLVSDPIQCVRRPAADAAGDLVAQLTADWSSPSSRATRLLAGLVRHCAWSKKSSDKQIFIRIACSIAACRSLPGNVFSLTMVPSLVELGKDGAATVRTTWAREVCPLLRSSGGRFASHKELVSVAMARLTDTDDEVARLAGRVTYSPADELVDSCPPSPTLDCALWFSDFKSLLKDPREESLSQFVLIDIHSTLPSS